MHCSTACADKGSSSSTPCGHPQRPVPRSPNGSARRPRVTQRAAQVLCNAFLSAAAADGSRAALRAARELLPAMRLALRDTYTYAALLT
jgi:hypothetical protein